MLPYRAAIHVLIDYREILTLLEVNSDAVEKNLQGELKELVAVLVYDYFSRYSEIDPSSPRNQGAPTLKHDLRTMENWEHSYIAQIVATMLVRITQQFLPNFHSHRSQDCAGILNITVKGTLAHLEIDPDAYQSFIKVPDL